MARLPQPGGDSGTWGDVLNDYLSQTHKSDGSLKDNIVTSAAIARGAVTTTEIADATIDLEKLSTTGTASGTTYLRGDGTWAIPPGAGGGISNVADDPTPQLGGDLDLNSRTIGVATDADLTKLHSVAATATELDYVGGVTSSIQTQLSGKAATSHTHTASQVSDSTTTGRSLLTAADAAAARTAIGAGTSSLALGTTGSSAAAGNDARLSDARAPTDNSVSTAKIQDNAVTNAKLADDAVGLAELSATGTASATTFLRGDNTWAIPTGAGTGYFNVKDFGALGNNTVDDTAAIQAAIDAATGFAATVNKPDITGIVFLPPGGYRVSQLTMKSRVALARIVHGWWGLSACRCTEVPVR